MTALRRALVLAGLAVLVLGTVHEVVTGAEHWPFSSYPMFSRPLQPDTEGGSVRTVFRLRLIGVTTAGDTIPLRSDAWLAPFQEARLRVALRQLEDDPPRLRRALADVADRYETRRAAGRHDGPELAAIRLERHAWAVEPGAEPPVRFLGREVVLP